MSTPGRAVTTYRDDPRWLAARAELVADTRPGEGPYEVATRGILAAVRMYLVECEHEGIAPDATILSDPRGTVSP